jgi:redox-sensitive bicupin YhaK (pirin superfamily)
MRGRLAAGARVTLSWPEGWDAGLFATDGPLLAAGEPVAYRELVCFSHTGDIVLGADTATRCILIGGAPLEDTRAIWGNFVLGTVDECKQAQADFEAGRFGQVV